MPEVRIPSPLRGLTDGASRVMVDGHDLGTVLVNLDAVHPGVGSRLVDAEGGLHRFVHVFVGDAEVRDLDGLDTPVAASDTITIVPAVAGGAERSEHARRGDVAGGAERKRARTAPRSGPQPARNGTAAR